PRGPFVAAADLMRSRPDLIVAAGPEIALQAVVGASLAVPIVVIAINYDPIQRGYVASLARPGGNITGAASQQLELAQKQVELLTQAFPDRARLAILFDALSADQFTAAERAHRGLRRDRDRVRPAQRLGGLAVCVYCLAGLSSGFALLVLALLLG